jgi:hypothetical protein
MVKSPRHPSHDETRENAFLLWKIQQKQPRGAFLVAVVTVNSIGLIIRDGKYV